MNARSQHTHTHNLIQSQKVRLLLLLLFLSSEVSSFIFFLLFIWFLQLFFFFFYFLNWRSLIFSWLFVCWLFLSFDDFFSSFRCECVYECMYDLMNELSYYVLLTRQISITPQYMYTTYKYDFIHCYHYHYYYYSVVYIFSCLGEFWLFIVFFSTSFFCALLSYFYYKLLKWYSSNVCTEYEC